jgi:hypothetical protein
MVIYPVVVGGKLLCFGPRDKLRAFLVVLNLDGAGINARVADDSRPYFRVAEVFVRFSERGH